jgi:hypothetical protein
VHEQRKGTVSFYCPVPSVQGDQKKSRPKCSQNRILPNLVTHKTFSMEKCPKIVPIALTSQNCPKIPTARFAKIRPIWSPCHARVPL